MFPQKLYFKSWIPCWGYFECIFAHLHTSKSLYNPTWLTVISNPCWPNTRKHLLVESPDLQFSLQSSIHWYWNVALISPNISWHIPTTAFMINMTLLGELKLQSSLHWSPFLSPWKSGSFFNAKGHQVEDPRLKVSLKTLNHLRTPTPVSLHKKNVADTKRNITAPYNL